MNKNIVHYVVEGMLLEKPAFFKSRIVAILSAMNPEVLDLLADKMPVSYRIADKAKFASRIHDYRKGDSIEIKAPHLMINGRITIATPYEIKAKRFVDPEAPWRFSDVKTDKCTEVREKTFTGTVNCAIWGAEDYGIHIVFDEDDDTSVCETIVEPADESLKEVTLRSVGPAKLKTIKILNDFFRLGLKEAKDLVDLVEGGKDNGIGWRLPKEKAEKLYTLLFENHCDVSIR